MASLHAPAGHRSHGSLTWLTSDIRGRFSLSGEMRIEQIRSLGTLDGDPVGNTIYVDQVVDVSAIPTASETRKERDRPIGLVKCALDRERHACR